VRDWQQDDEVSQRDADHRVSYYDLCRVEILASALRHAVDPYDMQHALKHALVLEEIGDDPVRWLVLGPDRAARFLELVVLDRPQGPALIHAMPMRSQYAAAQEEAMSMAETHGTKKDGTPITDAMVEELADEAERGYDVGALKRRSGRPRMGGAPASVESVRLDPELKRDLLLCAAAEGISVSEVIRRALRDYVRAS